MTDDGCSRHDPHGIHSDDRLAARIRHRSDGRSAPPAYRPLGRGADVALPRIPSRPRDRHVRVQRRDRDDAASARRPRGERDDARTRHRGLRHSVRGAADPRRPARRPLRPTRDVRRRHGALSALGARVLVRPLHRDADRGPDRAGNRGGALHAASARDDPGDLDGPGTRPRDRRLWGERRHRCGCGAGRRRRAGGSVLRRVRRLARDLYRRRDLGGCRDPAVAIRPTQPRARGGRDRPRGSPRARRRG